MNHSKYDAKRGCPQGGCASPTLWKIGMNNLLKEIEKLNVKFSAYADDLIVLISSNSLDELENRLNQLWQIIEKWCLAADLQINRKKTLFMFVGKRDHVINLNKSKIKLEKSL